MPMPITIEMNITEKSERWPITRVAMPIDQQRLMVRTTSISTGLPTRRNATSKSPSVRAKAMSVARPLSRNAATISSFWSAGLPLDAGRDVAYAILNEAKIRSAFALGETQVDEVRDERGRDLRGDALGQLIERRAGRERLHEFLVVEDRVADRGELFLRQVQQGPPLELLGVDPVRDPLQRDVVGAQLADEARRVDRRLRQGGRVDGDDDALDVRELVVVLREALDVGLARRQQGAGGGGEGEVLQRVGDRDDRQGERDRDGQGGSRAGDP